MSQEMKYAAYRQLSQRQVSILIRIEQMLPNKALDMYLSILSNDEYSDEFKEIVFQWMLNMIEQMPSEEALNMVFRILSTNSLKYEHQEKIFLMLKRMEQMPWEKVFDVILRICSIVLCMDEHEKKFFDMTLEKIKQVPQTSQDQILMKIYEMPQEVVVDMANIIFLGDLFSNDFMKEVFRLILIVINQMPQEQHFSGKGEILDWIMKWLEKMPLDQALAITFRDLFFAEFGTIIRYLVYMNLQSDTSDKTLSIVSRILLNESLNFEFIEEVCVSMIISRSDTLDKILATASMILSNDSFGSEFQEKVYQLMLKLIEQVPREKIIEIASKISSDSIGDLINPNLIAVIHRRLPPVEKLPERAERLALRAAERAERVETVTKTTEAEI